MGAYPLDPPGSSWSNFLSTMPYPAYPYSDSIFAPLVPPAFFDWSLQLAVPVTFALAYYTIAHTANHFSTGHDYSRGSHFSAKLLRAFVVLHNAGLCLYSLVTFLATAPVAIDLVVQGYRAAGQQGMRLALCSVPTNTALLGRWAYFFYLSKYYEVMDSVILYLKGKKIGNLQSYHHAGALFSMWIAYRFQAQPVWVFCAFNSGVHTLMYAYYFTASLKLPFPKTLKRNLTTLQILQIFSGTLLVNLYFFFDLQPAKVLASLTANNIHSILPAAIWASDKTTGTTSILSSSSFLSALSKSALKASVAAPSSSKGAALLDLSTYAQSRASYGLDAGSCIESKGVAAAIIGNTVYMGPLLVLFARFYIRSYFAKSSSSQPQPVRKGAATTLANGKSRHNGKNGVNKGKAL